MLLRRVIEDVKAQNWTAIAIDFFIVVVGVFIGIQVANWNEVQNNKSGLVASLDRLDKEVSHNLQLIDEVLAKFAEYQEVLNQGRDALNACDDTAENKAALEHLLFGLVEDIQPNFSFFSLDQLASQSRYQDLLTTQFQEDFGRYAARLKEEHEQLKSHYDNIWQHHVNFHPDVGAYFPGSSDEYIGWGFRLDKPFAEICRDASFRNRFINSIGIYTAIKRRLGVFKGEAEQFQEALAIELQRH